ncbi:MAG: adenylate kinase [Candidatus Methanomethylicia archaeon]
MKRIVILGPPGSGKGTQAKLISEKYGVPHISTGDVLRENISKKTKIGEIVREYIERGELVPDEIIIKITIDKLIEAVNVSGGYILDGYPRTIPQAEALEKSIIKPEIVIDIKLSEDECVRRLTNRRYCPNCGEVYNMLLKPPRENEKCDKCNVKLLQREDDREDVIRRRFKEYYNKTKPVMDYYRSIGKLVEVDGGGSIEEIHKRILEILKFT